MARSLPGVSGALLVAVALTSLACAGDPQVAKRKYYERGQEYFGEGKYREAALEFRNAIKLDPRYAEAHYALGRTHLKLGRWQEAFKSLEKAVDLEPRHVEARLELAELHLLARNAAAARAELQEVEAIAPGHVRAQIVLGKLYFAEKDFPRAVQAFEKAKQAAPRNPDLWSACGLARVGAGQHAQAEKDFRRAIELDPSSGEAYRNLATLQRLTGARSDVEPLLQRALAAHPRSLGLHLALAELYFQDGRLAEVEQLFIRMRSHAGDFPRLRLELGDFWMWRNEVARAVREYEAAVAENPDPIAQKKLISAYLTLERVADAERLNDTLLKNNPAELDARAFRGALAYLRNNFQGATQELQAVVKEDPYNLFGHYYLGLSWLALNNVQQGQSAFLACVRLNEKFYPAYLKLAEVSLREGDGRAAAEYALKALQLSPSQVDGYLLLAQAYMQSGNLSRAEAVLQRARKLPDPPAELYEVGARLAALRRDDAGAIAQYEQALARTTRPLVTLTRLAEFQVERGRTAAAIERIRKWAETAPPDPAYHELLAQLYLRQGDSARALAAAQKALELEPTRWSPHLLLGQAYQQQGQPELAVAHYEEATRRHPPQVLPYILAGNLLVEEGHYERAKPFFDAALRQQPNSSQALHGLARLYAERGDNLEVALNMAQELKKQSPQDPYIADTLGWIYSQKGVYQLALEQLRPAARDLPNNATVHFHLGMTYFHMGDEAHARQALERASRLGLRPASRAALTDQTLRKLG